MESSSIIALEKAEFKAPHDSLHLIRRGSFWGRDGVARIAAFKVSMADNRFLQENKINIMVESDKVIQEDQAQAGPAHQTYEWVGGKFEFVDPDDQDWFKFF